MMINPFKAVVSDVGSMFQAARGSDCAPGPATVGVVILTPVVAVVSFVSAFFIKNK